MEEETIFSLENLWLAKLLQKIIQEEFIFTKTIISGGQDIFTQASLDNTNVFLQHLLHSFNEFLMKMSNLLLQQIIQEELLKHLWASPMPFFLIFLTDSMSLSSRCPIYYFSKLFKKSYSSIFGLYRCLSSPSS